MSLIALTEYARRQGIDESNARKKAARGGYTTATKIGKHWLIDEHEPNVDGRLKSRKYVNAREKYRNK